jgi:hypothetical protein
MAPIIMAADSVMSDPINRAMIRMDIHQAAPVPSPRLAICLKIDSADDKIGRVTEMTMIKITKTGFTKPTTSFK